MSYEEAIRPQLLVRGDQAVQGIGRDMLDDAEPAAPSSERIVVVLGAGFSRALYRPCPLTDDLGEAVRARLPPAEAAKLPPTSFVDGRFEEWLSYLSEVQPHFTTHEAADAKALALLVIQCICDVLSDVQEEGLLANSVEQWFWDFLSVLHVLRAQVVTLNYDNFMESGVHTIGLASQGWFGPSTVCEDDILAGLPPCADFPGRVDQTGEGLTHSGNPLSTDDRRHNTFKLLKLHGSLSWYWLPDSGGNSTLRRWQLPGVFGQLSDGAVEQRRQQLPAHEVFVVPPASLKGQRLMEPVMKELWRRSAEAISNADRIVLMGYSVPPADHSIMGMLSDGIQGRDVKIEIVNPAPSIVEQRLVRLGAASDVIDCICGENCIAEWTASEVQRLAQEAVIALRNREDLSGDVLLFASGPHVGRFRSLEVPTPRSSSLILHMEPPSSQLVKPKMYSDLRPVLESCSTCVVEVGGRLLPVIDHWVREGQSGAPMTQLHLVTAGR